MVVFDSRTAVLQIANSGGTSQNISPYVTSVDGLPGTRNLNDVTTYGSTGHRYSPGLEDAKFTIDLVYSEDANVGSDTVFGILRTNANAVAFNYMPSGTSGIKYTGNFFVEDYSVTAKIGDAVRARVTCRVDNNVNRA